MKKRLLVVSAGLVHPTLSARRRLDRIIGGPGLFDRVTVHDIEDVRLLSEQQFAGVVLYFHRSRISERALSALDRFVARGGGLLAIHGASASFKDTPGYFDILGGRFVSHGKIEPYTVSRAKRAGDSFAVREPFTVTDELYIHRYDRSVTVHYTTETPGGPEPVVWTRTHGKGRVCYVSLGHVAAVFTNDAVCRIVSDALAYITANRSEGT